MGVGPRLLFDLQQETSNFMPYFTTKRATSRSKTAYSVGKKGLAIGSRQVAILHAKCRDRDDLVALELNNFKEFNYFPRSDPYLALTNGDAVT